MRALVSSTAMLVAAAAAARGAIWPGAAPCDTTLQACIDGVPAGDTVLVGTDVQVNEDLSIAKSLTLAGETGVLATLVGSILLESGATATSITLRDLTIVGSIRVVVHEADLDVHIVRNVVVSDQTDTAAMHFGSGVIFSSAGKFTIEVQGNGIQVTGTSPSDFCSGVLLLPGSAAQTSAAIVDNTMFVSGCTQGGAILVNADSAGPVTVDVLRNELLVPNSAVGISLHSTAVGPTAILEGRVVGNLVRGELFGVGVRVLDSTGGTVGLQLVNNTVVEHDAGVLIIANAGDPVSGQVANNIVAFNSSEGLRIDAAGVSNRNNLVFDNNVDNFTPGPGTLTADPQFVGGPSFDLLPTSPAIDAGNDAAVPADVTLDLDGDARIQGVAVDIGAFEELGSLQNATAVPALSPTGLVLLGALLTVAAARFLRRE
jgi:hypothetical protein